MKFTEAQKQKIINILNEKHTIGCPICNHSKIEILYYLIQIYYIEDSHIFGIGVCCLYYGYMRFHNV